MKNIFLITYNEDVNNYDLVRKIAVHGRIVEAKMLVSTREINPNFESVPDIVFFSDIVFQRAVPVANEKDLPKYLSAATKTSEFAEMLKGR